MILIADFQRTLGASARSYLLPAEEVINIAIANNNNGSGVTITLTVTGADGRSDPAVLSIAPYTAEFLLGVKMKGLLIAGNGANISIVVTSKDEQVRIEPTSSILAAPTVVSGTVSVSNFAKVSTWIATYRLAARPYALSFLFGANTRKQFALIWHPSTSTRVIRLRRVLVALESASAAAIVMADLIRLGSTVPSGGNPAISPAGVATTSALADASLLCLALPTTPGNENSVALRTDEWNLGITAAGSVVNPPPPLVWHDLLDPTGDGPQDLQTDLFVMRSGVAEGYAVVLDCNAAITVKAYVLIEFQEETT